MLWLHYPKNFVTYLLFNLLYLFIVKKYFIKVGQKHIGMAREPPKPYKFQNFIINVVNLIFIHI